MNRYPKNNRTPRAWILLPMLAVVAILSTVIGLSIYFYSNAPTNYYGSPYFGWWFGWPFFGFGWIFIPLVFILIFFGIRLFFWRGWGLGYYRRYYDPALEILRERFARGEITKEQYDQMTRDLRNN